MIVAIQYYMSDMVQSMQLARLLADLEPKYRDDVVLGLVCQPGTPYVSMVRDTIIHCSRKFPVEQLCSRYGAKGWADGSGQLWTGTMTHFYERSERGLGDHDCIFTLDGNDGVPLHNNWIDLLMAEHRITKERGKMVTGTLTIDLFEHPHINGNMGLEMSIWRLFPSLHTTPLGATMQDVNTWDVYHSPVFLSNASASSVIANRWQQRGVTLEKMDREAVHSIWLHGYKDPWFRDMARDRLLRVLGGEPTSCVVTRQDAALKKVLDGSLTRQEWELMGPSVRSVEQ